MTNVGDGCETGYCHGHQGIKQIEEWLSKLDPPFRYRKQ